MLVFMATVNAQSSELRVQSPEPREVFFSGTCERQRRPSAEEEAHLALHEQRGADERVDGGHFGRRAHEQTRARVRDPLAAARAHLRHRLPAHADSASNTAHYTAKMYS